MSGRGHGRSHRVHRALRPTRTGSWGRGRARWRTDPCRSAWATTTATPSSISIGRQSLWPFLANGMGSSLELIDPGDDVAESDEQARSLAGLGRVPGHAGAAARRSGVVINEVLAGLDSRGGGTDQVELLNTPAAPSTSAAGTWAIRPAPLQYAFPGNDAGAGRIPCWTPRAEPDPDSPGPRDFRWTRCTETGCC